MKLNKLFDKARKTIDERGGIESLKEDAQELKGIAGGERTEGQGGNRSRQQP